MQAALAPARNARQASLAILCAALPEELDGAWRALEQEPAYEILRAPEAGLAMVRGRIGGGGAPFNFGEVTITRCAVRLASGEVGFGHVLGRDRNRARLVACFDALFQTAGHRAFVEERVLAPVAARIAAADDRKRAETAATRVNFFTMVRGDDP